jgi:hypothetical protein
MRIIAVCAATVGLVCVPLALALAQTAPDPAASSAPAATAPPSPPSPPPAPPAAAAPTPSANAPAPTAEQANSPAAAAPATGSPAASAPAASPPSANAPAAATDNAPNSPPKAKKKKPIGTARRHEIEKSIESGTVPSRYRSSVPKEYQQYIPFSKD